MFLPTEYMQRNGRAADLLKLPCSLFLETDGPKKNEQLSNKVVLVLLPESGSVRITRYDLPQLKQNTIPKPESESLIERKDVFTSPLVVIPKAKLLPFNEGPYIHDGKQETSMPMAAIQERTHRLVIDNYYFPRVQHLMREEWLWKAYEKLNVANELRLKYSSRRMSAEQEAVRNYAPPCWRLWEAWKAKLLICGDVAPEFIFAKAFGNMMPKNVEHKPPLPDWLDLPIAPAGLYFDPVLPPPRRITRRHRN